VGLLEALLQARRMQQVLAVRQPLGPLAQTLSRTTQPRHLNHILVDAQRLYAAPRHLV
jgi:hypothetical protein